MRVLLLLALAGFLHGADRRASLPESGWFEFRNAVYAPDAPAIVRGAVEFVFHDWAKAERNLQALIAADPRSADAKAAHSYLFQIYSAQGRYQQAVGEMDTLPVNQRALYQDLARLPRRSVTQRGFSSLCYRKDEYGHIYVPVRVNGRPGLYDFDTGSGNTYISETEVRRLGLPIRRLSHTQDTGGGMQLHITGVALAEELVIGNFCVRNVAFQVLRELPDGADLGNDLLFDLETLRWTADGTIEIGFPASPLNLPQANLCFDGDVLFTAGEFRRRPIPLLLDTGNGTGSYLRYAFTRKFAGTLPAAPRKGTYRLDFLGERRAVPDFTVPELVLSVGGFDTRLRPAHMLRKRTHEERWVYGHLGLDLLNQARLVTLDLKAMRLMLEN